MDHNVKLTTEQLIALILAHQTTSPNRVMGCRGTKIYHQTVQLLLRELALAGPVDLDLG